MKTILITLGTETTETHCGNCREAIGLAGMNYCLNSFFRGPDNTVMDTPMVGGKPTRHDQCLAAGRAMAEVEDDRDSAWTELEKIVAMCGDSAEDPSESVAKLLKRAGRRR